MTSADESLNRALHAIADPSRLRILATLREGAGKGKENSKNPEGLERCLCGGDIEERIHLSQPTISHHMAILTRAGLVETTKRGQWRWYRRNDKAIRQLVKTLKGKL
jgi:DNA-binding transcriptional ArsR family regulator